MTMKKILAFAFAALFAASQLMAQPPHRMDGQHHPQGDHKHMDPSVFLQKAAERIATELSLDEATKAKFIPVYKEYKMEMMKITRQNRKSPVNGTVVSEEDLEARIKANFDNSRKMLDIRETYYNKFHTFMSARQILKVYEFEQMDAERMKQEHMRRHQGDAPGHGPRSSEKLQHDNAMVNE